MSADAKDVGTKAAKVLELYKNGVEVIRMMRSAGIPAIDGLQICAIIIVQSIRGVHGGTLEDVHRVIDDAWTANEIMQSMFAEQGEKEKF